MIEIIMHAAQASVSTLPEQTGFLILKFTDPNSGISVTIPMTTEQAETIAKGLTPKSGGLIVPKQNLIFPVK